MVLSMTNNGDLYREPGGDFYTIHNPDRAKQRALDQLKKMGYDVTLTPSTTTVAG
jgi:transposase